MTARPISTIVTIAAASAAAMVFAGCGSDRPKNEVSQNAGYRRAWSDDDVRKPAWITDPTNGGQRLAAWGSIAHDPWADAAQQRDRATDSARRELARMVAVKIQAVMQDYTGESGDSATTFSQSVGRSIAIQSIRGSAQRDAWVHPKTSELFVLVVVDPAFTEHMPQAVASVARQAAASDPTLDAHVRAKVESDKGFAELDRLLERSSP